MKCLSTLIHSLNTYFTSFYFQNLKKQKYLFTSIVLRSSSYSTKIALKWTKIMLQSSVISIWNPQNQGYKIGNIYNYWDQPWSPKNGLEMLLRILSANTVDIKGVPKLSALGYLTIFCSLDSQKDFRGQNIISTGKEHFWVKCPEGSGYL